MTLSSAQLVPALSRLLVMELDAVQAYRTAVASLEPGPIRVELELFMREHRHHAALLREHIVYRGYRPPEVGSGLKGIVLGALGPPSDRPPGLADVLAAARANERLASALHGKLLAKDLPEDARALLEAIRADEERHRGWAERAVAGPPPRAPGGRS